MGIMERMSGRPRIYGILEAEHREVDSLLSSIQSTNDPTKQRRLFEQMRDKLDAHARAEQEVLYARLLGAEATHELILEAFEEHRIVLRLLGEIERLSEGSDRFLAKCKVLHELVKHHVREEERHVFPKGRQELSGDEDQEIVDAYRAAQKRHLRKGKPGREREVEHRAK